jgi:hypothetical protein
LAEREAFPGLSNFTNVWAAGVVDNKPPVSGKSFMKSLLPVM